MPDIYDLAQEQRDAVLALDRAASADLVRAYAGVARAIRSELDDILDRIRAAQKDSRAVLPSWLDSELRLSSVLRQLEGHMDDFTAAAQGIISDDIRNATGLGAQHVEDLVREQSRGLISFRRLDEPALQAIVQFTDRGALHRLLDSFGPELSQRLRGLLVAQLATGRSPETTARLIRAATGAPLTRSITIARTESMRAYREASHRSMSENGDVLEGWYWLAKLARNTCAACWSKHGTKHRTSDRLYGHPRCRCTQMPFTKSWEELGYAGIPESRPDPPVPGSKRFERLSEESQRAILGPGRFEAYQRGTSLADMTYTRQSKTWGPSVAVRSLPG